jgi:hypothetical protein
VAAAVGGVVSAAAVATAARLRAASGREAARAATRDQLHAAAAIVAAELAGAAGADGPERTDVAELSDTAVDVRATVGGGVACAVAPAGGSPAVDVAAATAGVGWWAAVPQPGDVALLHDPGALPEPSDDAWLARAVRGAATVAGACAGGPFATPAGAAGDAPRRLTLDGPPLPATVGVGAPVRVLRRRRYTLYRGGDGLWALGLREWDAAGWQAVQPLAGPLDGPRADGMRVQVRDAGGAPWTGGPLPAGAAVTVTFGASRRWGARAWRDSARAVVRLRGDGGGP